MKPHATALLVVDVQVGAFDGRRISPLPFGELLLTRARVLIDAARQNQLPIIFVQHRGEIGGAFEADSDHFAVHPALDPRIGDVFVQKEQGSAFVGTALQDWLSEHHIERLIVCGLQSEYCVTDTTRSAITLGYTTVVASDAHETWDAEGETARLISDRQNAVLASLGAKLLSVSAIVQGFAASTASGQGADLSH